MTQEHRPQENPAEKPVDPTREKEEKVCWIDGLAKRSAGLPDPSKAPKEDSGKSPWSYAGTGIQFVATAGLFAFMGMYVDAKLNSSPWATVGLSMLGVIGGLYLLIKDAIKRNADPPPKSRNQSPKDGSHEQ